MAGALSRRLPDPPSADRRQALDLAGGDRFFPHRRRCRDPWWKTWFKEAGLENPGLERYPPNEFGTQAIDVGMALAAQGVAIANPGHFREEIAEGRLYQPFDITCNDGRDYWLVCQEARRNVGKIRAFREWILEAMPREV